MKLSFPNQSRSFDGARGRIRFWGYDGAIEISFFVEADALRKLVPDVSDAEAGYLSAFDTERDRVHQVADQVYSCSRQDTFSYILSAADF